MENKDLETVMNSEAEETAAETFETEVTETETAVTESETTEKKPNKIITFLKSRKAKHGSIATVIVAIAIALVILINAVCSILVENNPGLTIDLTASKTYQLQADTLDYLKKIDTPVTIYVLTSKKNFLNGMNAYGGKTYFVQAEKLLSKIDAASDKIEIKYIDLSENPTFSSKYPDLNWSTTSNNYLLLVDNGKNYTGLETDECFTYDSSYYSYGYYVWTSTTIEQAVVTGILDVTTGDKVKVEFLTSEGEDQSIYSPLMELLNKNAYDTAEVSLTTGDLSADSEIAIIYGPTVDISEEAGKKIEKWLSNDGNYGKTLIYLPVSQKTKTPNLDNILDQYGMKVDDSLAFTESTMHRISGSTPYVFLADYPEDTTYTKDLKTSSIPVVVLDCRPVNITDENVATPLLNITSSAGTIPFDTDTSKIQSEKDLAEFMNPDGITLAAVGKKTNDESASSNVAVFGSYAMFHTSALSSTTYNNANYIVNFCNTVTNRGDMGVTITSSSADSAELGIFNATPVIVVGVVFIAVVPLFILLMGLVMYLRRRNG